MGSLYLIIDHHLRPRNQIGKASATNGYQISAFPALAIDYQQVTVQNLALNPALKVALNTIFKLLLFFRRLFPVRLVFVFHLYFGAESENFLQDMFDGIATTIRQE